MASSPELVQYIADQLSPCGTITFKKMFGEYGLYLNGKMFASVCDDARSFRIACWPRPIPAQKTVCSSKTWITATCSVRWPQQPAMNCPHPNRRKRFQNDGTFPFFRLSKGCTK